MIDCFRFVSIGSKFDLVRLATKLIRAHMAPVNDNEFLLNAYENPENVDCPASEGLDFVAL